jgi:uncharacterized membrane protein YfhO
MRSDAFRPHSEVVFETSEADQFGISTAESGGVAGPPITRVDVTELTPEKLVLKVGPHRPGYLVMSEIYYPGWRAEIDALETPIIRCNSILRCVRLPGSDKPVRIAVDFRPATLRRGAIISGLTSLFVLSGLWFSRRT